MQRRSFCDLCLAWGRILEMKIHQFNPDMKADTEFIPGELSLLVEGNCCRLLDARRTPGIVEKCFSTSAMFRWRITDFEDKGGFWDLPIERIIGLQFAPDSKRLSEDKVKKLESLIEQFNEKVDILIDLSVQQRTIQKLAGLRERCVKWFEQESKFYSEGKRLNLQDSEGPASLRSDTQRYMRMIGLAQQEELTTETYVLNPDSGEWFKGLVIVLAELGLQPCSVLKPRTEDIFKGIGSRENRAEYLLHRMAFLQTLFKLQQRSTLTLFRGMSAEGEWRNTEPRAFSSWTFKKEVAESFVEFDVDSRFKHSYLIKRSFPVNQLLMSYLETDAMNRQYKEAEAVVRNPGPIEHGMC